MNDQSKTKKQLIDELVELRQQMDEMQGSGDQPSRRASEARLRSILNAMDDLVFVLDQDNRFVSTYAPEGELYLPSDDFLGKTHAEFMPAHIDELFAAAIPEVKRGKTASYEYKLEMLDGPRWYAMKLSALMEGGEYTGLVAVARDITERVRGEQEVRESEERYQLLSDATFEAIFLSEKGICLGQNKTAEKMFGYTLDEALGRPGTEWIVPGDRDTVMKNMLSGYERPYEVTALRKDGSTFPCEIQGRMMDYKGKRIRITALRDIAERVRAEQELQESEERLRAIAENVPGVVYSYIYHSGKPRTLLYVSPGLAELIGPVTAAKIGDSVESFFDLVHPDDRPKIDGPKQSPSAPVQSSELEFRVKTDSGEYKWVRSIARSTPLESGDHVWHGVLMDITERVRAQEEIQARLEEISMLNRFSQSVAKTLLETDEIAMLVAQQFVDFMGFPECSVSLYDPHKGILQTIMDYYEYHGEHIDSDWMGKAILLEDYPATAKVIERLEPLVVQASDPDADPAELAFMKEYECLTLVIIPLVVKGRVIGILELEAWEEEIQLTAQELDLAMNLANQVAVALDNAQLYETAQREIVDRKQAESALKQYTRQLELLREASLSLTSNLSLQAVLDTLLEYVLQLMAADDAHIFIYDNEMLYFGAGLWVDGPREEPFAEPRQNGLTYTVARSGECIVVNDMSQSPIFQDWPLEGAIAGFPLLHSDQVVGVMNVAMNVPHEFSDSELRVLELLADQAAIAITNAHLYGQVQQHAQQLETLNTVTAALTASLALDEVLQLILDQIQKVIPCDSAAIFFFEGEQKLRLVNAIGSATRFLGKVFPLEETLLRDFEDSTQPIILKNAQEHPSFKKWKGAGIIRGWMGVPLVVHDDLIGYLTLDSMRPDAYSPEQAALVNPFAAQAAQAIANARLYKRVIQDANEMEKRVQARTEELQAFVNLTAGREIRMAELKKVIRKLRAQLEEADMEPVADDPLSEYL